MTLLVGLSFTAPLAAWAAYTESEISFVAIFRFVILPMFLFSGTFFPISNLPAPLEIVAWLTPLWHGVTLCRDLTLGDLEPWADLMHLGYLLAWAVVGVFVFAAIVTLDLQINTASTGLRVGAAILLAVGVYQLTQTKAATLDRARSPLALLDDHGDELMRHGIRGALQVGIWHGGWALGCWAGLMAVLVALGVVNVGWMAVVTAAMLAEKLAPASWAVPRAVGGLLLLAGVATLITA